MDLAPITVEGASTDPSAAPIAPSAPQEGAGQQIVQPAPGKIAIRDTDGTVSLIKDTDLGAAAREGARPATEVEYYGAKTGVAGQAMSAAAGVGRGLSFGAYDPLAIEADRLIEGDKGAAEMRHQLNLLRETNPNANLGGEIAGSLAGMFVGVPPGAAVEAEGSSMLARAASRFAQGAPRAFGEGAAMGVGQQMSEDALGDHDATAENYVASGLKGGLLNMLIGGALHAGGGAVKDVATDTFEKLANMRPAASSIDKLAEGTFGYQAPGVGERVQKWLIKASAGLSGKDPALIEALGLLTPEAKEARRIAVLDSEKEISRATTELRNAGDEMLRGNKLSMSEFQGELKADKIASNVKKGNEADVVTYAKQQIAQAIDVAERELTHADGVAPQAVKSLEGIARTAYHAQAALEDAVQNGGKINETAFMGLDSLKRDVQRWTSAGYSSVGKIADPFEARLAQRSVGALDSFQGQLIKGLEDNDLWGRAGDIQKAINADWTIQIDASKRFHQALTTDVGRDPANPFRQVKGIDPSKLDTYARGLLNPNADLTHQAVKDYVSSTESLARTLRHNVQLTPETLGAVDSTIASAGRFKTAVEKAEKVLTATNQFKQLTERSSDGYGTLLGLMGLHAGPLGAIAGTALGTLANPGRAIAQMAALERMGAKLDAKFNGGLSALFSGKRPAQLSAPLSQPVNSQLVSALRQGASNRPALIQRVADALGGVADAAPKVARSSATVVMRAAQYIVATLPKDHAPAGVPPFVNDKPRPMKASDLQKAQAAVEVLNDPSVVVDALYEGRLSRDHIEALKFIYPKMFAKTQAMVREYGKQPHPNLTIQKEVGLSVLFEQPINAMMQPQNIRGFQAAFAQGPDPSQDGSGGVPTPSKRPLGKSSVSVATEFDRQEAPS